MKRVPQPAHATAEPVELLILRILRHSVTGTLLSGAAGLAGGCETAPVELEQARSPSGREDAGEREPAPSLRDASVSTPSSPADSGLDAGRAAVADATAPRADGGQLDGQLDATTESATKPDAAAGAVDGAPSAAVDGGHSAASEPQSDGGREPWGADDASVAMAFTCPTDSHLPVSAERLRPARAVESLSVRTVRHSGPGASQDAGDGWTRTDFTTVSETGTPCATASGAACASQVERHPEELVRSSCLQICVEHSIVTTEGDVVARHAGQSELVELLAPIDSADEAAMLVASLGYDLRCDEAAASSVRKVADGFEVLALRITEACAPYVVTQYRLHITSAGAVHVLSEREFSRDPQLCIGRIPAGLTSMSRDRRESTLGDYLARCAHLEGASVFAFERLARELTAHGAPRELIAQALHAADDEVRHARVVAELARAHGGEPTEATVACLSTRSLEEVATENAVEGCVRETYGALVGGHQARCARAPRLRVAMREIAADEARHAALSQRVHSWALSRLSPEARVRVLAAQRAAIRELAVGCTAESETEIRELAGLPSPEVARGFVVALSRGLWSRYLNLEESAATKSSARALAV